MAIEMSIFMPLVVETTLVTISGTVVEPMKGKKRVNAAIVEIAQGLHKVAIKRGRSCGGTGYG